VIKINNRKILNGIAEVTGEQDKLVAIVTAIDKLDKIGEEGVVAELQKREVSNGCIEAIRPLFHLDGTNSERLDQMSTFLASSEIGMQGIEELLFLFRLLSKTALKNGRVEFDVSLARGLNYYTGAIFEVLVDDVKMGSICGGGRYDDLTALFGLKGVSGVGISFGADRIYDVLNTLSLFPDSVDDSLSYLFLNFGENEFVKCFELANAIRDKNIDCEVYPSAAKIQKQMKYANERRVQHVIMIGTNELSNGELTIKSMESGTQRTVAISDFLSEL
jgi:histidyl-tRNA synthetase